ncbi:amidohydrolase family protein [Cohnella terricola]|uniref:Amidohydrolase n=1 Tax=Cohnella terricola TaxID=1289167 RepID=A0A559JWG8_9BACL|nr:amidohydrolase family protein [Cohnella terricola]TVY04234.1 amidohydrolase [Cohnella terricola]
MLEQERQALASGGLIDADVHPFMSSLEEMVPYTDRTLRKRLRIGEFKNSSFGENTFTSDSFKLPFQRYDNIGPLHGLRTDAVPPSGKIPGADKEFMVKDLLDRYDTKFAVLNAGGGVMAAYHDVDLSIEFNRAYNDYLYEEWVNYDPRFKMTMMATPLDPQATVREIERIGRRPGVVGINLQNINIPLGKRHFYPIYEIAEEYGLPIILHPDAETSGEYAPAQAVGPASTYMEWHTSLGLVAQRQIISLVCDGVFERFPKLKVAFIEYGFSWLPSLLWRIDKNWKALREEVPWMKRLPSEYILQNIRIGTQPSEEPFYPGDLNEIIRMSKAEDILIYCSDYPHWDGDPVDQVFRSFSPELKEKVFSKNGRELFGL